MMLVMFRLAWAAALYFGISLTLCRPRIPNVMNYVHCELAEPKLSRTSIAVRIGERVV